MKSRLALVLCPSLFALFLVTQAQCRPVLFDDFDGAAGAAPDTSTWARYRYSQAGDYTGVKLDGNGNLFMENSTNAYGNYVGMVSVKNDFDAFGGPLTITLLGTAVGPGTTSGTNEGYLLYGRSNSNSLSQVTGSLLRQQYHPATNSMAYAVAVIVKRGAGDAYSVVLQEYANNVRGLNTTAALNGAPTDMSVVIDGKAKKLKLTVSGTAFTDTGLATREASLSDAFTRDNLCDAGVLAARITIGASNGATPTSKSSFTVGSISATLPPTGTTMIIR